MEIAASGGENKPQEVVRVNVLCDVLSARQEERERERRINSRGAGLDRKVLFSGRVEVVDDHVLLF